MPPSLSNCRACPGESWVNSQGFLCGLPGCTLSGKVAKLNNRNVHLRGRTVNAVVKMTRKLIEGRLANRVAAAI